MCAAEFAPVWPEHVDVSLQMTERGGFPQTPNTALQAHKGGEGESTAQPQQQTRPTTNACAS
jgi:hypothetical protein